MSYLVFKKCLWCNKPKKVQCASRYERTKYCSYSCRQKHKITTDPRYKVNFEEGKKFSSTPEANAKKGRPGEKHHKYKMDRGALKFKPRPELNEWKNKIFLRDGKVCCLCGEKDKKLIVDHIKPYAVFPDLRFDLENGRVLCEPCHRKTDTYGSKTRALLRRMQNAPISK